MLEEADLGQLFRPALNFYKEKKRDLPWRADRDPYHIWVSEIMLQQTRVEAVKPYYARWMTELPTIDALANCPEDRLLKLWEGLGYYNRVRNMQKAAQIIMKEYDGQMPADYEAILALPGIGAYTAGAISSIAFELPYPAVDGNVLRILSRVSDDYSDIALDATKKKVTKLLQDAMASQSKDNIQSDQSQVQKNEHKDLDGYLLKSEYGLLNQSLMEIGATVCLPNGQPHCEDCPWENLCLAKKRDTISELPVKKKAKGRRIEKRTVLLIRDGKRILIDKRPSKGLLAGLYEFPNIEKELGQQDIIDWVRSMGLDPLQIKEIGPAKHIFSHIEWHMMGYEVRVASVDAAAASVAASSSAAVISNEANSKNLIIDISEVEKSYAIPSAFAAYTGYLGMQR